MACACYVIILQRILYWFVREKADDSPVSDLLPANLHLLYHLWKPLNMDFTYKQMFFCILFHLLWFVFANILPSGVFICLELASRGRSMSTVTSSTSSFSVCSFRTLIPESVSSVMTFFWVNLLSYTYFPIHLEALPHIMTSEPSALNMRILKSALADFPINASPSEPIPVWRAPSDGSSHGVCYEVL